MQVAFSASFGEMQGMQEGMQGVQGVQGVLCKCSKSKGLIYTI